MHYKPNSVDVEAGEKAEREGLEENGADEDSNSPRDHRWQSLHIEKPMKSFVSQKEYQNRPIGGSTFLNSPGNKTLYDEIYYVSGIKENYFMMISDNMQLLELPLGLVKEEVKLGQPIRVRLETDGKRWQTDQSKFKNIQKELYRQYSSNNQQLSRSRGRISTPGKTKKSPSTDS